jgi:Cys-rich protein (TIGR01571 family)
MLMTGEVLENVATSLSDSAPEKMSDSTPEITKTLQEGTPAPTGKFRNGLCDWTEICCTGQFWFGFCCTPVMLAQMLGRMGLNWNGSKAASAVEARKSYVIIWIIWIFFVCLYWLPFVGWILTVFVAFYGTRLRMAVRAQYQIPTSTCGDGMEDCCCVFWCGCCSAIQMTRHTHDQTVYPYNCCTYHGLPEETAPVVEIV